ncbi:MAG: VanZ family protein [Rhodocyclaceae bacterium]
MVRPNAGGLARHLTFAYALLIVYASLHPFTGWVHSGAPLLAFLSAPWPRYYTWFDLSMNVLAYVPLGLVMVPGLPQRWKPGYLVIFTVLTAALLSFSMELLQHLLPSRVPSNVDLGCNALGALIGALMGVPFGRAFREHGSLSRWRARRIQHGALGDAGIALLVVWLVSTLNPEIPLLGNGDLRGMLDLEPTLAFTAGRYFVTEQMVVAAGVLSVGLLAWLLMREPSPWLLGTLFVLAFIGKGLAAAALLGPVRAWDWVTPGAMTGAAMGASVLLVTLLLPKQAQATTAALVLLLGTVLVNLAPPNPYLLETWSRWNQGHFLNFNGLTRLASTVWPFLALALIIALPPSRLREQK